MTAFKRGKKGYQSIYVPTRHGGLVQRSTGSSIPSTVRGMRKMVTELKDRSTASGNWSILDAIYTKKLKLTAAFSAFVSNELAALEAKLSSTNLAAHLDAWIAWVRAERRDGVGTADVYWQQVTTLIVPGESFLSSELTEERVMAWLASRTEATSGTRRKYFYALKSFVRYLKAVKVYSTDPLAGMKAPKKDPARKRWVPADVDESIVKLILPKYRAVTAFIKATGCDVSAALRTQRGDINLFAKRADVRGTKTDHRRVVNASIEAWAIPYLTEHLRKFRDAPAHTLVFAGIERKPLSKHHAYVCEFKANVPGYTLKDSRHSVGVRMRRAGRSFEDVAAQLGTSVYQAVTVYAAYTAEQPEQAVAK